MRKGSGRPSNGIKKRGGFRYLSDLIESFRPVASSHYGEFDERLVSFWEPSEPSFWDEGLPKKTAAHIPNS